MWTAKIISIIDSGRAPVLTDDYAQSSEMTAADIIHSAGSDGVTLLHQAVMRQHIQAALSMIELLDAEGGDSAAGLMGDVLALALRTQSGSDDIIFSLLRSCTDLHRRSAHGETVLHVAVQMGRIDYVALIVRAMRNQDASLDVADNSRAWTPLFFACAHGHADIVQLLVQAGSSQTHQDRLGWTAKEVAVFRGHLAVADLLESPAAYSTVGALALAPAHVPLSSKASVRCGYDQNIIIATLGTTRTDQSIAGVDLSFCSSAYTPNKHQSTFVLEVSVPGVVERRRVPLPILDDRINDPFVFVVPETVELCLVFDVIRLTDGPGNQNEVLVASGTALLARNHETLGAHRQSLVREQTIPMLERDTMRMAGVVTFTPLVVHPFSRLQTPRCVDLARSTPDPPLLVGHRGAGQNSVTRKHLQVGENTITSFLSAAKLGASFVEFDIQVTRDLQPVAFHDFSLSESGTDVPIHEVTLDHNPLVTAPRREAAGRSRSRSLGRYSEVETMQIHHKMKHTVDFQKKGFKPNTQGDVIHDSFATLQDILVGLPQNIGCDIEIKYPRLHESVEAGVAPVAIELNTFVDVVLEHIDRHAGNRQIVLTSFTPEICILLAMKQRAYPILFITNAGKVPMSDMEVRAASLQGAMHFAERWGLAGVVFACDALLLCPRLVGLVKGRGLICGTYGTMNNDPNSVEIQVKAGVDMIVADRVGLIARALALT
ncbi:Glycerophosphoryl diester phosphodiesterase family-domain-containing protein [Stachybotrys elegans]|uniref:Glycerophosphoryl diester phosphodiesterase family-domain-containing protein n=1 Tax=Stachybotrys elegans TaxID=80388 RepID=A0A8K0WNS1_9HYPO|nr:Glycerophosphoryl diester phosphodiesterase family-domain-containing protein [Stachybotrys elegans]